MNKETFFQHLCEEIKENSNLYPYYKLNEGTLPRRKFREVYYQQRLHYIDRYIDKTSNPVILDCGCGYGSTCLYLAMNGVSTKGTTLEYYVDQIETRKKYWEKFGDSSLFSYVYENIFDNPPIAESLDYIILQDTLHHIEPIDKGLSIFYEGLKKGGKLIMIDTNGSSIPESLIFFLKRGNKRVIEFYDEKLKKNVIMGNENFRSEKKWINLFVEAGFTPMAEATEYVRFFLPFYFKNRDEWMVVEKEQQLARKHPLLKRYGFFGLNMVFTK